MLDQEGFRKLGEELNPFLAFQNSAGSFPDVQIAPLNADIDMPEGLPSDVWKKNSLSCVTAKFWWRRMSTLRPRAPGKCRSSWKTQSGSPKPCASREIWWPQG